MRDTIAGVITDWGIRRRNAADRLHAVDIINRLDDSETKELVREFFDRNGARGKAAERRRKFRNDRVI
jgi:hypothetical protein